MIEIKGLSKTFKTANGSLLALDNVNLRLEAGEMVGIIGMSGAGKTTLLRCLSLLEKPDEGAITIDGLNLLEARDDRMRDYRQKIGVVFQGNQLLKQRNVYENIAFPLTLKGEAKQNYPAQAKVIDQFGQTHYILVEPELDEIFQQGQSVILTQRTKLGFQATPL